jgi:urease accessory protein
MNDEPLRAGEVLRAGGWSGATDRVVLDYDARFLRRKRLTTEAGRAVMVDLAQMTSVDDGDALRLADGSLVAVVAASEALLAVTPGPGGATLARLAWHVGNRHTPCQIEPARLLVRRDPVLQEMLAGLGSETSLVNEPFLPEGGAYGHGRTLGHSHGGDGGHDHEHVHEDDHPHGGRRVRYHSSHVTAGDEPDEADI